MSRRFTVVLSFFLSLSFSQLARADLLDVNISNDAVASQYLIDMGQGFFAGASILHEEDAGDVASLDLLVTDDLRSGEYSFTAGVGGKIMGIFPDGSGNDGGSLVLGGFGKYKLPQAPAVALRGELFYGPSVTSFESVESVLMYQFGTEVEVIERAMLHANYRKIRVNPEGPGGKIDIDEGINVGIKLEF